MPSPAHYSSPASPPAHGGDSDPNEIRRRPHLTQPTSASFTQAANSSTEYNSVRPSHGGNTDPNETRHRQIVMHQMSGSSSPAPTSPGAGATPGSQSAVGMVQTQTQPAQYGSSSHLITAPIPTPSGYNAYQSPQSPQTAYSESYFPTQGGHQPAYPHQPLQSPHTPQPGFSAQVGDHHP